MKKLFSNNFNWGEEVRIIIIIISNDTDGIKNLIRR